MTSVIAAFLVAILASPAVAKDNPAAAQYEAAYQKIREKAKKAYLAPSPIDEAVTKTDLQTLEPQDGQQAPAERKQKTADFAEAVNAVKTLQGAPEQPVLAPAEKMRLMRIVYARFGLNNEDQSKAVGTYQPAAMAPAPFAKAPPESVLKAAKARQDASVARATDLMSRSGGLGPNRSVEGGIPAGGYAPMTPAQPSIVGTNSSEFRPASNVSAVGKDVPSVGGDHGNSADAGKKTGVLAAVVGVIKTPLPYLSGAKAEMKERLTEQMAKSDALQQEGSQLMAKGGVWNTIKAGALETKAWGHRISAANPDDVANVAKAAGATALAVGAVLAAPVVITAAGVVAGGSALVGGITIAATTLKTGVVAYGVYSTVKAAGDVSREPDYANAAGLALGFVGASYAGPVAGKAAHLAEKAVIKAVATEGVEVAAKATITKVTAQGAVAAVTTVGSVTAVKGAAVPVLAETAVVAEAAVLNTVKDTVKTELVVATRAAGHATKEGVHEVTKVGAHSALHVDASEHAPTQLARVPVRGPFSAALPPMAVGGH